MGDGAGKAIRLLHLMALLEDRPYSVAQLAELCGVSRQSIYRDLQDLQGEPLRYPLVVDGGRWRKFKRAELG